MSKVNPVQKNPVQKVIEMRGYVIPCVGDWMWACFDKFDDADSYIEWLEQMGYENRGMMNGHRGSAGQYEYSVRFLNRSK